MMKTRIFKAFALLLWLGLWQAGCYPDKFDPEGDEVGPMPTLDFSDPSVEFKAVAESRTVTVTTNYKTYRVEVPGEAVAWCHVASDGMTLSIAVDDNPFARERSATISVTVGKGSRELTKTVSVFQAGMLPQIKISGSRLNFGQKDAGVKEVTVTINQDEWTYSVLGGDDAWFEVSREGDRLQVKPRGENTGKDTRRGYVNLTSTSASSDVTASGVVVVEQIGTAPAVLLSEDMLSLPAEGGERRVQVVTNQPDWQIHLPSVDWYEARAEGGEMVLTVKRNTGGNARKSELTVASGTGNAFANLSLAQLGTAISLEVSADTLRVDASESYSTLRVTTNADEWEASVVDGSGWCELLEDANSVIVYTRAHDNTMAARECVIRFTAGSLQKEVRVIQLPDMTLTLNHDTLQMAATGETRDVLVITNQTEWSFSMPGEVAAWCSAKANGNTLSVTVNANGEEPRSGEIVVSVGKPGMEKRVALTVTQAGVSDREVLMSIWKEMDIKHVAGISMNWGTDRPINTWGGVKCNEEGRVIELNFGGDFNVKCLSPKLGELTELERISAYGCGIAGEIPAKMGNLKKLKYLDLSGNKIVGGIPKELCNLTELQTLNLTRNALTGEIPLEVGKWIKLMYLYLDNNYFTGKLPIGLGDLSELVLLYLHNNDFEGNIPVEFGKLLNIVHLSMHNNNLEGEVPEELGNLVKLQTTYNVLKNPIYGLSMCGNRLTGEFPAEVMALPHWESFVPDEGIFPQQEGYGFTFGGDDEELGDEVFCVSGGSDAFAVKVASTKNAVVDIPAEYSWIRNTTMEETDTLRFTVDANTSGNYRKGVFTVKRNSGTLRTVSVYQGIGDSLYIYVQTPGTLRELVGKDRMATTCGVKLSGTLGQDDYDAMKYSMAKLTSIDMEDVENTTIPARAFYGKTAFQRLVLPSRLEEIGDNAFYDCGFRGELKLPESVTKIGFAAFQSCNNFTGVLRLPDGLREIGEYAFAQCTGLRGDLVLPDGITVISRRAFYGNYFDGKLVLPAACVEIGESAFSGCESLTGSVIIPDGVKVIGKEAFNYCKNITGVTLSGSLETISEGAFNYCIKLDGNLVVPSNVKSIGDRAFADCAFKGTLTLPSGLETIGIEAFRACPFTGNLNLPSTLIRIGEGAFSSCSGFTGNLVIPGKIKLIEASVFSDCRGFNGTLTLPSGLEEIGDNAFWSCKGLSGTLVLPTSLRTIGENAFSYCDAFTGNLTIPEGVTTIKRYAFACKSMGNTIILPSTLVSLGYQAFYGMPNMKYVRCNRKEPLALSLSPFANASECTLIVPKGTLEAYKTANKWNEFSVIEEEN